ncbi:cytochrome P450 [Byssothecium circinans]|uniref:Cytochrome P450 n=1 Tax=Byssothecium circinans TaxID=147558 RepID=A0A6A5TCC8_9PLEO|nr:cytochrome P450 [Byssothecium circinans]
MLAFESVTWNAGLPAAVAIAAGWFSWYAWKFFFSPLLYRDEPRELPYLIPFVGHTLSMVTGAHRMFSNGRKRFGNKPWAVTIMGESLYVISSAEDVQAVYRAPKTLDFDPFIKEMLSKYGITADTASRMFDTLPGHKKNWMETSIENFKLQLHRGAKLDIVQKKLLGFIDDLLVWDRLRGRMVLQDGEEERVVSLYSWSEMVIVDAQTRAFFDEVLYEKCPDLLAQFQIYEDESWKVPMDLPDFSTKALRSSKSSIEKGLRQYLQLPQHKRPNESWIVTTLCEDMDRLGLEETQKVHVLFSFYRVMNANAYKLVFWIISHLLFEPKLMKEIADEVEPAFRGEKHSAPDLDHLLNSCPLLESTCEEVLRLTNWPIGTRTVQADTVIGGKKLRQGRKLLMPYRAMHFDSTVFGADAAAFNPRRFLEDKNLVANKSYRPFGGAAHYCPGRYIARTEVQMYTAVMLKRFDMSVTESDSKGQKPTFPKMDNTLPSGGIQVPLKGEDLIVRVRPSK